MDVRDTPASEATLPAGPNRLREIEAWRSGCVRELQGRLQAIANERWEVRRRLYKRPDGVVTSIPQEARERLEELERERERVKQELLEVEAEAARREREPVDPGAATVVLARVREGLEEELERERGRRKWFAYQLLVRGMEGYRSELGNIERRIGELEVELERVQLAAEFEETLEASERKEES